MIKNIAVSIADGTPTIRNAITNFCSSQHFAFWHWIDDFWIIQVPGDWTAKSLAMKLRELPDVGLRIMLVLELPKPSSNIRYFGRANSEAWEWLEKAGFKVSEY